jgi:hypothetical protein
MGKNETRNSKGRLRTRIIRRGKERRYARDAADCKEIKGPRGENESKQLVAHGCDDAIGKQAK